jgi:hypothetical protein
MTLPEPPLPTLGQLASALATSQPAEDKWKRTDSRRAEFWYGTASEALAAAIQALVRLEEHKRSECKRDSAKRSGNGSASVWFPAYFCNDALRFIRRLSIDLRFYDVEPDLGINWERLDQLTRACRSSILVLVHYFGFPNQAESAAAFCSPRSIALVEDAAHSLTTPGIASSNAVIFSPRKLFPVPGGGLLLADERIERFVPQPVAGDESAAIWSWAARRLVQRGLTKTRVPWHFLSAYRHPPFIEAGIPGKEGLTSCNPYIRRLLAVVERDLPEVIKQRREHYLQLLTWCASLSAIKPMYYELPQGVCPYVFPVQVKNDVRRWVDFLRSKGIPASRWPDLPPEAQDSKLFPESVSLAEHTVLLPIHQSLTTAHLDRMGRILRSSMEVFR